MRIALVQEQRFAAVGGDRELALERFHLRGLRRIVAEVVQAGFADGFHLGCRREFAQQRVGILVVFVGVVRMHAGGRVKEPSLRLRERERGAAAARARARHDDLRNARSARAREHGIEVGPERFVGQVGADVDEIGERERHRQFRQRQAGDYA